MGATAFNNMEGTREGDADEDVPEANGKHSFLEISPHKKTVSRPLAAAYLLSHCPWPCPSVLLRGFHNP